MQPEILAQFVSDLDVVCPMQATGLSVSPTFFADLETAYTHALIKPPQVSVITVADLRVLGETFEIWRSSQLQLLDQLLEKLPEDDPLRSPVSLFGSMDYGRLETAHTRTLAWLLGEGKREHGFDYLLLEAVLRHLLKDRHIRLCGEVTVESERWIEEGRFDIFAEGSWTEDGHEASWRMVIEAKIDAKESEGQLPTYDKWLEQHPVDNEFRVFLTPQETKQPSSPDWQTLTFIKLASVLRSVPSLGNRPGYHFLRYYLTSVLKDICGMSIDLSDRKNPYATVEYLKAVLDEPVREDSHGQSR